MPAPAGINAWEVTLGGVVLSLLTDPTKPDVPQDIAISGSYQAQESDNQLVYRDVPKVLNAFHGGFGAVRRTGPEDDNRYAWAESMYTHFGEGPIPAGQVHDYDLTTVTNSNGQGTIPINNAQVVEMIEFLGHLWLLFSSPAMIRIANCDPASTPTFDPAINNGTYGTATTAFGTGYLGRCAEVFQTAGGADALCVGVDKAGVGRVYEITGTGSTITAGSADFTTGTTFTAKKARSVWWADKATNAGAQRLLLKVAPNVVRHCIAGSDPKLQASYGTPITIGTPADEVQALVASDLHAYAITNAGIVDFNELRVRRLTPYWRATQSLIRQAASVSFGLPGMIFDDHIYASRGYGSVDRYPVTNDGYQQRIVGECGPASVAQDGTPISNLWITAMCDSGDGALLMAGFNPDNGTSYIGRAYDRNKVGIPGRGPLVHYWAEVVIPPSGGQNYMVSAMHVAAPSLAAGSVLASPKLYLWIALIPSGGGQTRIKYVDMPIGTGPLSLRASGGTSMAHAASSRIYMTGQQYGDANALKAARRLDLSHQSVSSTATIGAYVRADGDPATLTTDGTWTLEGTANASAPNTSTQTNIVPSTVTTGKMVYTRLDFTTPSPYTAPPRLQELRLRCNVRYEVFDVRYLNVILERNYELANGSPDLRDPDATLASIVAFQLTGPVTLIDHRGVSYQVLVEQGIRYTTKWVTDSNTGIEDWRTVAIVQVSLVKAN